ncbi:lipoprotein [Streptomyces sp. SID8499]|uniref:lipoprotein n=1 Tax=Streptomyces sp. SID8499 TaxID=2706106 RepID=UPI0013C82D64|nr:hypothetical protein [Streptomyces sp. SID8499]
MSIGAVTAWRVPLAVTVLLGGALTGCADGAEPGGAGASAGGTATSAGVASSAGVARSGGRVGAAGSACPLPVAFDVAAGWKAKAVDRAGLGDSAEAGELADALLKQGPVTAACEIDAKPAGNIGFLRVYTAGPAAGDARTVLRAFVAAEGSVSRVTYRAFESGGLSGVEADYLVTDKLLEEKAKKSAVAVSTSKGPVVLHLGGLDTGEHDEMLPAYELAKRTLGAT